MSVYQPYLRVQWQETEVKQTKRLSERLMSASLLREAYNRAAREQVTIERIVDDPAYKGTLFSYTVQCPTCDTHEIGRQLINLRMSPVDAHTVNELTDQHMTMHQVWQRGIDLADRMYADGFIPIAAGEYSNVFPVYAKFIGTTHSVTIVQCIQHIRGITQTELDPCLWWRCNYPGIASEDVASLIGGIQIPRLTNKFLPSIMSPMHGHILEFRDLGNRSPEELKRMIGVAKIRSL